jgi:COX assembly protein 1
MAAMAPSRAAEPEAEVPRLPMPSRNPLPLSAAQEAQVREVYHARVRGYCAAEIKSWFSCYYLFLWCFLVLHANPIF